MENTTENIDETPRRGPKKRSFNNETSSHVLAIERELSDRIVKFCKHQGFVKNQYLVKILREHFSDVNEDGIIPEESETNGDETH